MSQVLRAAVAGTGFMGYTHVESLRRLGVEVVGILGSSPAKGMAAADELSLSRSYASFEELAADRGVDVVHICTPNHLHHPMTVAAIMRGKHVVVEKPLAMNSAESADLVRLARDAGVVGVTNYNQRYYPMCYEARARVRSGEIGEVRVIQGGYLQEWMLRATDWNWRADPSLGGVLRTVGDIGSHWLDIIVWMTGLRPQAVMSELATFHPTRLKPRRSTATFTVGDEDAGEVEEVEVSTEDYAAFLLRFDGGARAVATLSQVSPGRKNHFWWEISGTEASLSWDAESPNELWVGHRERPNELIVKDSRLLHPEAKAVAGYPEGHAEGYPDTFRQLFKQVYAYIAAGDFDSPRPFPTFEDGHLGMVLVEAVLKGAREGRWVEVQANN